MKKAFRKILFDIIIPIIIFMGTATCIYYMFDETTQNEILKNANAYNEIIYTDGTCDENNLKVISNIIDGLPQTVKDALHNDHWKIYIAKNINKSLVSPTYSKNDIDLSNYYLSGVTLPKQRVVYLYSIDTEYNIKNTFTHEIGHLIAYEYGNIYASDEFYKYYNKYKNNFKDDEYMTCNASEFFASCYNLYMLDKNTLKEKAPDIYTYLDKIYNQDIKDDNLIEKISTAVNGSLNIFGYYIKEAF